MIPPFQPDVKGTGRRGEFHAPTEKLTGLRIHRAPGRWPSVPDGGAIVEVSAAVHTGLSVLVFEQSDELEATVRSRLAVVLGRFEALDYELRTRLSRHGNFTHANAGMHRTVRA